MSNIKVIFNFFFNFLTYVAQKNFLTYVIRPLKREKKCALKPRDNTNLKNNNIKVYQSSC